MMHIDFPDVTNAEDWVEQFEVAIDDNGTLDDLSDVDLIVTVRKRCGETALTASIDTGEITVTNSVATMVVPYSQMMSLETGPYMVGIVAESGAFRSQLALGRINVVEGIVR